MSKEKQIEEMARDLCIQCAEGRPCYIARDGGLCESITRQATAVYNAGYRKQSEGEWTYGDNDTMKCTLCRRRMPKIILARFCPNCGAKMKGV